MKCVTVVMNRNSSMCAKHTAKLWVATSANLTTQKIASVNMPKYTFGVWIDIESDEEDGAILAFDEIMRHPFVKDKYCFDWKEIKE